ncbi:MAG: class I SAM-dependent methyltransferase [bacterium]|nr:class I SAM-dependent methyltransferase [bacterium]
MELNRSLVDYFKKSLAEVPTFWGRFPNNISFKEKSVLDIGCGDGALCIDIARKGAKKVIGIDTNKVMIEFAKGNLDQNFPELKHIIEFKVGSIGELPNYENSRFDIITSKSAFEHILDPVGCLEEIKLRLNPGSKVYIGFGPLYNSPLGDHGITKLIFGIRIPWAHSIFSESFLVKKWNKKHPGNKIKSISKLGLNMFSFAEFKNTFYKSGLKVEYFKVNTSTTIISKIFSLFQCLPFISEYFSHNIYCILRK